MAAATKFGDWEALWGRRFVRGPRTIEIVRRDTLSGRIIIRRSGTEVAVEPVFLSVWLEGAETEVDPLSGEATIRRLRQEDGHG